MDERTTQIRERAGLEESRLNTEFLGVLQKYSSPVLIVLALVAAAFAGNNVLKTQRNNRVNEAFAQHAEITESASPSPVSLRALQQEHGSVRAIGILARLREADVLMQGVRTGMQPGADFQTDAQGRTVPEVAESDLLSEADRESYLARAGELYAGVMEEARDVPGQRIHALGAAFGLAAVAETRGDKAWAQSAYSWAVKIAEEAGFEMYAAIARERSGTAEQSVVPVRLYSQSELPASPEPAAADGAELPVTVPAGPEGPTPDPTPDPMPEPTPEPAPEPAPAPEQPVEPQSPAPSDGG